MGNSHAENENVDWRELYDVLSRKFEGKERELAECKAIIARKSDHAVERLRNAMFAELFDIRDNLQRVVDSAPSSGGGLAVLNGIEIIMRKIDAYFDKNNVRRLSAGPGEPFDPTLQEAVEVVDSDNVPAQHVVRELRCGYAEGARIFRPVQVVVSRGMKIAN